MKLSTAMMGCLAMSLAVACGDDDGRDNSNGEVTSADDPSDAEDEASEDANDDESTARDESSASDEDSTPEDDAAGATDDEKAGGNPASDDASPDDAPADDPTVADDPADDDATGADDPADDDPADDDATVADDSPSDDDVTSEPPTVDPALFGGCPMFECRTLHSAGGSISTVRSVDAFFTTAIDFEARVAVLEARVDAALARMALAIGAEVGVDSEISAVNIVAKIDGGFDGRVSGALRLDHPPATCRIPALAAVQGAARCDANFDPTSQSVDCRGTCVASDALSMVTCSGDAELTCVGTAEAYECAGSCQGACEGSERASCAGECLGSCVLDGASACNGECLGDSSGGFCTGECRLAPGQTCDGVCLGTCQLHVAGTCLGRCRGECTASLPLGSCPPGSKPACEAAPSASVTCEGECFGTTEAPNVAAECETTAEANAKLAANCPSPDVWPRYEVTAELLGESQAAAQLELGASLAAFANAYGELLAASAQLELTLDAGMQLAAASDTTIQGALSAILASSPSVETQVNASCALEQLSSVAARLGNGSMRSSASLSAVATVLSAVR